MKNVVVIVVIVIVIGPGRSARRSRDVNIEKPL